MTYSPEARIAEIYLLSLQTFCCQQVASEVPVADHSSLVRKTYQVYRTYLLAHFYLLKLLLQNDLGLCRAIKRMKCEILSKNLAVSPND